MIKRQHNYIKKTIELQKLGIFKQGLYDITWVHDDSCGIFKNAYCDCDPEYKLIKINSSNN